MLKGILEEINSDWLNPVVLEGKKTGKLRFCVNFRAPNDLVDKVDPKSQKYMN